MPSKILTIHAKIGYVNLEFEEARVTSRNLSFECICGPRLQALVLLDGVGLSVSGAANGNNLGYTFKGKIEVPAGMASFKYKYRARSAGWIQLEGYERRVLKPTKRNMAEQAAKLVKKARGTRRPDPT